MPQITESGRDLSKIKVKPDEYVEEQGPLLEDGERYPAKVVGFAESENQYGPRLVWQFECVDDGGEVITAAGFTSFSMSNGKMKSKLIEWSEALLGGELPEEFELGDLVGKECRVDIRLFTKESSGITKNYVQNVVPPKKKPGPKKKEAEPVEEDFDDIDI